MECKHKPRNVMWSDELEEKLNKRDLKLINKSSEPKKFVVNETIMDYAVKHMQEKDKDRDEVALLNYMQLCKQMTLPCELVGLMGREETYEHKNELA